MADKWIQLMSENGVDNLYPTSNMDLLWENASPTSSFAAQTLSIDLSGYKSVIGSFKHFTNDNTQRNYFIQKNGIAHIIQTPNVAASSTPYRTVSCDNQGITLNGGSNTSGAIPIAFYGIK